MRRLFTVACLLLAIGFASLGGWQLERRVWKLDLIAKVNARVHAAPLAIPARDAWPRINARDDEYRRVRVRGVMLTDHETLVQAVTEQGPGWWVMTPLRSDQGVVLVNRGFVPQERRESATRRAGLPDGPVTVTGLIRMTEPHGGFLRSNDPVAGRWYSRDVAAIAQARGLQGAAPFFIDADATANPGGYPIGGLTVLQFRNTHLAYALTWFGLAGLCLYGVALLLRSPRTP